MQNWLKMVPFVKNLDSHMREVLSSASVAFVLKGTGGALMLFFNFTIARLLGAEGAGLFFLALTIVMVLSVFGRMGMDISTVRFISSALELGEWGQVNSIVRKSLSVALLSSIIISLMVILFAPIASRFIFNNSDVSGPLKLMSIGLVPFSLTLVYSGIFRGVKKVGVATFLQNVSVFFFSIPFLFILIPLFGVAGGGFSFSIGSLLSLISSMYLWRRYKSSTIKNVNISHFPFKVLFTSSIPILFVSSMNLILTWTDTIMLGIFSESKDVGIYNISMQVAMLTSFVLGAVNSILAPKFSSLYTANRYDELSKLAGDATRAMTLVSLPIFGVFFLFPGAILSLFGPDFDSGAIALMIISFGQIINVAAGSVSYLLIMCGKEKTMQWIFLGMAVVNILLNYFLIPRYGLNGAALASAASIITLNLIANASCRVLLGIHINFWQFSGEKVSK